MKRLIDSPPEHRLLSRARELIIATGPTPFSESRMRAARLQLDEPAPRARRARWLHAAIALALVGTGATAFALNGAFEPSTAPTSPVVRPRSSATTAAIMPRPIPREPASTAPAPAPSPSSVTPPAAAAAARRPPATPATASDVASVHEAARALRGEGDAARAQRLLEGAEISGPLAEEALALRIEAARARGDARAKALAQSYLSRYPRGRYRELAERTLAESKAR